MDALLFVNNVELFFPRIFLGGRGSAIRGVIAGVLPRIGDEHGTFGAGTL